MHPRDSTGCTCWCRLGRPNDLCACETAAGVSHCSLASSHQQKHGVSSQAVPQMRTYGQPWSTTFFTDFYTIAAVASTEVVSRRAAARSR